MAEYIKREDAINICTKCVDFQDSIENINASAEAGRIRRLIKELPTADVVERKHGKWINPRPDSEMCSACGVRFSISSLFAVGGNEEPNFCPNCGVDMRIYNEED